MIDVLLFLLWLVACAILVCIAFFVGMLVLAPIVAILMVCWEAWRARP